MSDLSFLKSCSMNIILIPFGKKSDLVKLTYLLKIAKNHPIPFLRSEYPALMSLIDHSQIDNYILPKTKLIMKILLTKNQHYIY